MRPGNFWLVDTFSILKHIPAWFPGAGFQRVARSGRELVDSMRFGVLDWSLRQYEKGKTQSSFFTRLMESYQNGEISLDIVRDGCAAFHPGEYRNLYDTIWGCSRLTFAQSLQTPRCLCF